MANKRASRLRFLQPFTFIVFVLTFHLQERKAAVELGYSALQGYSALAQEALANLRPCYKIRLKLHVYHHMLRDMDEGATLNPRYLACWTGEMWAGRLAKASKAAHPATAGSRVTQRRFLELLCFLEERQPQSQH